MNRSMCLVTFVGAASIFSLLSTATYAFDTPAAPSQWFVQAGFAGGTRSATLGLRWPWEWRSLSWGAELTVYTEASISFWTFDDANGRRANLYQGAIGPVVRLRPDSGAAAWFVEGGIALTNMTHRYETDRKSFSTCFNFGTQLAIGHDFGAQQAHEVSLRIEHFSNAGVRKPNPGENFVQLRYPMKF